MKFTASDKFLAFALGTAKTLQWKVYAKKTTVLNASLSAPTWVDCSPYIVGIPTAKSSIEYDTAQYTLDKIGLAGKDIAWWKANVFNASAYIEVKLQMTLGLGLDSATDECLTFTGFVDTGDPQGEPQYDELNDSVSFSVYSAEDIGDRMSVLQINTQYKRIGVDGGTAAGVVLPVIPGLYVVNANVTTHVLQMGLHTIAYQYNAGAPQAKLDDGDYIVLPVTNGLEDLKSKDGQWVTVYVNSETPTQLSTSAEDLVDYVIVKTYGATLPQQPYFGLSIRAWLKLFYSYIGIDTVVFDSLQLNTHDARKVVSWLDSPPMDPTVVGMRSSLVSDGTYLYIAIGALVYRRAMTPDETYTLVATLSTVGETTVTRMWYNTRNNDLWFFYTNSIDGDCLRRYQITPQTLGSQVVLHATPGNIGIYSIDLVDYNYTGTSYKYGVMFMYPESGVSIRFCDGASISVAHYWSAGESCIREFSDFFFHYLSNSWWFLLDTTGTNIYKALTLDASGAFVVDSVNGPTVRSSWPTYAAGVYSAAEDRIYYLVSGLSGHASQIRYHGRDDASDDLTLDSVSYHPDSQMFAYFSGVVYMSLSNNILYGSNTGTLYTIVANFVTAIDDIVLTEYTALVSHGSALYGLDKWSRLYRYSPIISMYADMGKIEDITIRAAINKILAGYNLLATISPVKTALVYRRADDSGVVVNSGSTLTITVNEASQILQSSRKYASVQLVSVSNGVTTSTYDGTHFDGGMLGYGRKIEISNDILPANILKDLAYWMFQFFSVDRDLYTLSLGLVPLFQYEPFDAVSVVFATTKIQKTALGVIYGATYAEDGSMTVEALLDT